MFDESLFLQSSIDGANSTQVIPLPADTYPGIISDVKLRQAPGKKDPSMTYTFCDVSWTLQVSPAILEEIGRKAGTARQSFMLDLTDGGTLDMSKGRNVSLGRLREALKQNVAGKPWNFKMLINASAKVKIKHRPEGENIYEEVDAILPAA